MRKNTYTIKHVQYILSKDTLNAFLMVGQYQRQEIREERERQAGNQAAAIRTTARNQNFHIA